MAESPHYAPRTPTLSQGPEHTDGTVEGLHIARPFSVTLLALLVLIFTGWNALRLGAAIAAWQTLAEYGARGGPLYSAVSGAFWQIVGITAFVGIWWGKTWGMKAAIIAAAGYASWYWFDRLVMQFPRANWPFALVVTIILLSLTLLTLRASARFFKADL